MADKFLSRPDSKQRILRLDLSPVLPTYESALVVTAELDRLTYFHSAASGAWQFTTRSHDPLAVVAAGPDDMLAFPWSRRNGVAAREGLGVVVFKRSIAGQVGLFIDLVDLEPLAPPIDPAGLEPVPPRLLTAAPLQIPLEALGFAGPGVDIWARFSDAELLVVLQAWQMTGPDPLQPPPAQPRLVLLRCSLEKRLPEAIADPTAWRAHVLDRGGFDLDARLEPGQVWVAHRRSGAAITRQIKPFDPHHPPSFRSGAGPSTVELNELLGHYPPVVVVSFDLGSGQARIEADDIPGVERPQLQRVDPIILTGDRLHTVEIRIDYPGGVRHFTPAVVASAKWLIWRAQDRWLSGGIGRPQHRRWPLNLEQIAGAQYLLSFHELRLAVATLASLQPVVLAGDQIVDKDRLLALIIEDPPSGAVVTDFYRISLFESSAESLRWVGRNVLDIGHETIDSFTGDPDHQTRRPAEHTQFLPFVIETQAPLDGGDVLRVSFDDPGGRAATRNTLGGLLVADQDMRLGLLAYVGMDDGGGRVVFAPGVDPLPPTTTEPYKTFPPEIVAPAIGPGRAWVELHASDWIDSRLPGSAVPTSDMLRDMTSSGERLLMGILESWLHHFTPRSIGSGMQLPLDALPVADMLARGSTRGPDDLEPAEFEFDHSRAFTIQQMLAGWAGTAGPFHSGAGSPFPAWFRFTPGVTQADLELTFSAGAQPPGGAATFVWTFTPPADPVRALPPEVQQGASVVFFTQVAGVWTVTLQATAENGAVSTVEQRLWFAPSLWTQVWQPQLSLTTDMITVGSAKFSVAKFTINYQVDEDGKRDKVAIDYLDEHLTQLRFLPGIGQQQGRIALRLPLAISSNDVDLTGPLAAILTLNQLDVSYATIRHFTPAISTSDRRSLDLAAHRTYAELDSVNGRRVTARQADVETVRRFTASDDSPRLSDATPNAITARPVDQRDPDLDLPQLVDVHLEAQLSDTAGTLVEIFTIIVALGLAYLFLGPVLAAIAMVSATAAIVAGIGLVALIVFAIHRGLSGWLRDLVRWALTGVVTFLARQRLEDRDFRAALNTGLENANLMTYAGEGLSEAIAIMALRQAIADGHPVAPPDETRNADGRQRFRDQVFETIAVGDGVCRVQLRVP